VVCSHWVPGRWQPRSCVHLLVSRDITGRTRRRVLEEILSWSPAPATIPEELGRTLETGLIKTLPV
jgi:hypothetical protein